MDHWESVVAHHEAGHAAVDIFFEHDVEIVTIVQDGERAGGVLVDRSGDDALRYEDELQSQVIFERRIMALMAGEVAQLRFDPASEDENYARSDRIKAEDYLDELDCPTQEIHDAYLHLLRLRTEALIERLWPRLERIASLLIERKTLSGDEMREAYRDPRFR